MMLFMECLLSAHLPSTLVSYMILLFQVRTLRHRDVAMHLSLLGNRSSQGLSSWLQTRLWSSLSHSKHYWSSPFSCFCGWFVAALRTVTNTLSFGRGNEMRVTIRSQQLSGPPVVYRWSIGCLLKHPRLPSSTLGPWLLASHSAHPQTNWECPRLPSMMKVLPALPSQLDLLALCPIPNQNQFPHLLSTHKGPMLTW